MTRWDLAAGGLLLACQRGKDHGGCATHTAIHTDRIRWAIELARATFHAICRTRQCDRATITIENRVWAYRDTHSAAIA
jgi:hypothetical protein